MKEKRPPGDFAAAASLETIAQSFETAWSSGEHPRLEEYLDQGTAMVRYALFENLLALEVRFRRRSGETPVVEEYRERFDEFGRAVDRVFAETVDGDSLDTDGKTVHSTHSFRAAAPIERKFDAPRQSMRPDRATFGRFELLELLGQGAYGRVYRARDARLDRDVAVKIPRADIFFGEEDVRRFLREARAAAQLNHPHIVPIYDAGKIDGTYYIASDFIAGQTLRQKMRSGFPPSHSATASLVSQLASALHYAHNKGIVHRDVKPENVIIDDQGEPHVMDFGLARREEAEGLLTEDGIRMGTPAYMSPEQAKGESRFADARSDLWGLGVIFYELLTGRRPFEGRGADLLVAILEKEPEAPRQSLRPIPKDLETVCLKCLAKDPEQRFPSCQHLADELDRWLRGEPITARPISAGERTVRWCRRNPALTIMLTLMLCSLVVGTVVSTYFAIEAHSQAEAAVANASNADFQKEQAENSAAQAELDRQSAERNASAARQSEAETRRSLYFADTNLAQQALDAGDVVQARNLLQSHIPADGQEDLRGFEWHYLWQRCHSHVYGIQWPSAGGGAADRHVRGVAFSPDGESLAVCGGFGATGEVKLYPIFGDEANTAITQPGSVITSLSFSPAGNTLAGSAGSVGRPGRLTLWDYSQGIELSSVATAEPVTSIASSPDGEAFLTGSAKLVQGHGSPLDRFFYVGSAPCENRVNLWSWRTGEKLASLPGETGEIFSVAYSPDGKLLAAGDANGEVHLWDAEMHQAVGGFHSNLRYVWSLAFSPDSTKLYAGAGFWDEPGELIIWSIENGELERTLRGHSAGVTCVAVSPDGKTLASGGWGRTIKLWDANSGMERATCNGHTGYVWSLAFSHDSRILVSGGWGSSTGANAPGEVKYWNVATQSRFVSVEAPIVLTGGTVRNYEYADWAGATAAAPIPDSRTLTVWDAKTGTQRFRFEPHPMGGGAIRSVSVSPDGNLVATCGFAPTTRIWDAHSGELVAELATSTSMYLRFSPNGEFLAVASDDGRVWLWDVDSQATKHVLIGHTDVVTHVDFTPDGRRLVSGSWDHRLKIWDTQSGRMLMTLSGPKGIPWQVAFVDDGRTVLSNTDDAIGLWNGGTRANPDSDSDEAAPDVPSLSGEVGRPRRARLYALLAMAHEKRGELDLADQAYGRAAEIVELRTKRCPAVSQCQWDEIFEIDLLAQFLQSRGRTGEKEQLLTIAANLAASMQTRSGLEQEQNGKIDRDRWPRAMQQARDLLREFTKQSPDNPRLLDLLAECENAYAWLIVASSDVDQAELAVELAESALARAPDNGEFLNTLGASYYRAGRWRDAVEALQKSCKSRNGGDSYDFFFLAMAHWQLKNHELAQSFFAQAKSSSSDDSSGDEELMQFKSEAAALLGMESQEQ